MPSVVPGAGEGARKRRTAAATCATLASTIHGDETTALDDLLLFDRFDRWTAPFFARHRQHSHATARKRLQVLVRAGVVVCAQGVVVGTGGSEPDLYILAPHGALVLDHASGRPRNATKAPPLSLGAALPTAGGRRKLKGVVGGTTPHVLNCLELALHHDWLGDKGWQIMRQIAYRDEDGELGRVFPDFARLADDQLWAVEVEGTLHRAHINEKHRRYAALSRYLHRARGSVSEVYLTIVLTFPGDADYKNARRQHELAFARQEDGYALHLARRAEVLAACPPKRLWDIEEPVDRRAIREREREHHERQRRLYDGW